MSPEEIERSFFRAGWEVPGPTRYPLVGNAGGLSITAHEQYALAEDPVFELVDSRQVMSYWVRAIPSPRVAAVLIEKHGGAPEEELGNPYKEGV
jgi:hypothetical protein